MFDRTTSTYRAAVVLGFALLICCGSCAIWLNWQQRAAEIWVRHTFQVGRQIDRVELTTLAVELSSRQTAKIRPDGDHWVWNAAQTQLTDAVRGLAQLTRDNPQQQARIRILEQALRDWTATMRASDIPSASVKSETPQTQQRVIITQLRQAEDELLRTRLDRAARLGNAGLAVISATLALAMLLAVFALLDRRRRMLMVVEANARLTADNARLEAAETASAAAFEDLGRSNRLLSMAETIGQIGHWQLRLVDGVCFWSDAVCVMHDRPTGYSPKVGEAIEAYHPDDQVRVTQAVDLALTDGIPYDLSARLVNPDGRVRHIVTKGRIERSPDETILGLFGVIQDVTHTVEADVALQDASRHIIETNRLLSMAQVMGRLGHWRLNGITGTIIWSAEILSIYGFAPGTTPTVENALAIYHPNDVERVRTTLRDALAAGTGYLSNARIIRPDGVLVHIVTRAEIEFDEDGKQIGLFGVVQDVTEQVLAEAARQTQQEQYRLVADQASDVIAVTDARGTCLFLSPSCRSVLGYQPDEMIGKTAYDYVPTDDHVLLDRHQLDLIARPAGEAVPCRVRMRRKDGAEIWMDVAARIATDGETTRIISVCRDSTDQVAAENELRHARIEAEAAATAKASFLANMSHEIRTPMNGVIGFTELLMESELRPDQRKKVELIADSGRAMMRLLNDILDLSKVEAGQMRIAAEPFDVRHTLRSCMKLIAPAIAKKGLDCDIIIAETLPELMLGDGLRFRQIVLNLLGNAVKFTEHGGVTLRASLDADSRVVVEVEDTGIGIAAERQDAIFEQFVQADSGIESRFGGTGLGLAISVQLARLMGGLLWLESEVGRGSRFYLSVPLRAVDDRRAGSRDIDVVDIAASKSEQTHDAVRVLVAEDHDVNQMLTTAMLEQLGYNNDIAVDGAEAVSMVHEAIRQARPYAIVLMDMQMPVLSGVDAARTIRKAGISADRLPIVALTANAYADDVAACLESGMQGHVSKPLHLADLRSTLERWIKPAALVTTTATLSANVRERYRQRKSSVLESVASLLRLGRFEGIKFDELSEMLHKLAGTAAMFGDVELGNQARVLETSLRSWTVSETALLLPEALAAILAAA